MRLFKSETLEVSFNKEKNLLVLECQGEVSAEACQAGFLFALQSAREHHIKFWLIDFRCIESIQDEALSWIQVQMFPRMMAYLGTDNYVAVLVSDDCYELMLGEHGSDGLRTYNHFIILNTFAAHDTAVAWLAANAKRKDKSSGKAA